MKIHNNSFYTPLALNAKELCFVAGGYLTPIYEVSKSNGYFMHYHPHNHNPNVHCWFGFPIYNNVL